MSPTKHKVIALISGGKDSLFSILHCLANGHDIVALANLYPEPSPYDAPPGGVEDADIDSYMYQTVGHSLIPLYQDALGIPLYRQPILGSAVCTSKSYAPLSTGPSGATAGATTPDAEADETESLVPLLKKVLAAHPSATAVSTGAILSTYQRTRIESVALRLGLAPLAFLWQYPYLPPYTQTSLLHDMGAVGMDARIIKVASGGLDEGFLGCNVADPRTVGRLVARMRRFGGGGGGAVLGEGGEFETLAVGGPRVLWKGRIELGETEGVVGEGGSAVLRIKEARVVENEEAPEAFGLSSLRVPELLDTEFRTLLQGLQNLDMSTTTIEQKTHSTADRLALLPSHDETWTCMETPTALYISNMTAPTAGSSAAVQTASIMHRLASLLADHNLTPSSIIFSTLLLRNMSSFTTINPIYGSLFTAPNPPARVTVACGDALPEGVEVVLSVVVGLEGHGSNALHVQSRSYWAPANIGPYSQAKSLGMPCFVMAGGNQEAGEGPQEVFVAGQIPLVPASMEMVSVDDVRKAGLEVRGDDEMAGFRAQVVLALQHLWRIGRAADVQWWTGGVAFLAKCDEEQAAARATLALTAWKETHQILDESKEEKSDEEEVDVWDLKNRVTVQPGATGSAEGDGRPPLPDFSVVRASSQDERAIPPCFVVQVDELPRGAAIEWASVGLTNCSNINLQNIGENLDVPSYVTEAANTGLHFLWTEIMSPKSISMLYGLLGSPDSTGGSRLITQTTVYASRTLDAGWLERTHAQVIPCRRVWGADGNEIAAAVLFRIWTGDFLEQAELEKHLGEASLEDE